MKSRNRKGLGLAQICGGLVVIVPGFLVCIDLATVALGASINDAVCRDAANAAAAGPPAGAVGSVNFRLVSGQEPYNRALAVVQSQTPRNNSIRIGDNIQVSETLRDVPNAETGGGIDGEVNVATTVNIRPPFLGRAIVGPKGLALCSRHVVPYTYTIPQVQ